MKTFKRLSRLLIAVGLSALAVSPVTFAASNVDGYINGEVTTTGGQPVADASVTVSSEATGFSRSLTTGADGGFRFPSLAIGSYTLTVSKSGYQDASRTVNVSVGVGTDAFITLLAAGEDATQLGTVTVTGAAISPIDISSTESSTNLSEATIDRIPVGRSVASVALLAPGTTQGDSAFMTEGGALVSFGGSTVGENVCYINGLDVTDQRRGLGCSTVPFEFYQEFQLKTGGISAEFGRTTGGVLNAVTKSGSNDFHWGASLYMTPWIDGISGVDPNTYNPDDGSLVGDREFDESTNTQINLWASGPIIKDKLFFFVLANPRDVESDNYSAPSSSYTNSKSDNLFWGTKIDWYLTSDHKLELTAFSDTNDRDVTGYDYSGATQYERGTVGATIGTTTFESGGDNAILKYTGYFGDDLTLSASYGINKASQSVLAPDEPLVYDARTGVFIVVNNPLGGGPYGGPDEDERKQIRIDGEYFLGDHTLRFGLDNQERTTDTNVHYTGSEPYTSPNPNLYDPATDTTHAGISFNGGNYYTVADYIANGAGVYEVRVRHYSVVGGYKTDTDAIYVEDKWQVNDDWVLSLGLRNETFTNMNKAGEAFVEQDNQVAPRLGFAWDAMGDGSLKVFGNFGRYYLPVANNTNVRFTGGEVFFADYYAWDGTFDASNFNIPGFDPNTPLAFQTFSSGEIPDVSGLIDADLEPMYQDEFILGFMKDAGNGWSWGVRTIFRDLKETIEDAIIGGTAGGTLPPAYALINPGQPVTLCDSTGSCVTYSVEETGQPDSIRKYNAVEFLFEKTWDGVWFVQGSYTWSQSYGNNEGYVKSDNGQTDAGITTSYDYAGLMDYSYGYLPNDRRNTLKLYGAWKFAENWETGVNLFMQTGRPFSAIGVHPTDIDAASYGAEAFYQGGVPAPRGSRGRTPAITELSLSLKYFMEVGEGDLTLGLDLINAFDMHNATELQEQAELDTGGTLGPGAPDPLYGTPTAFQTPRYLRLSAQLEF